MQTKNKRMTLSMIIVFLAIIIDQIIKFAVKLSMFKHESIRIFDWFYIYFTENKGMAFGMELFDKLFLTTFRMVAVAFIIYYLVKIAKNIKFPTGYIVCIAFVLAGAIGNLIDSMIYGEIFTDSDGRIAELVTWGSGYGEFLHGQVVDMFYFPLFSFDWPEWLPIIGGEHFIFFSPIFNFADACVSCGMIAILLFYGKYLNMNFKN
ncbi:MAG: lipoprotein signal peptidase [Bacteroidaceae bacterium]|nr:lipoprotein signal peptidase [Bacteroidaceae bacterium]MBR5891495.1 lipoprotein signal peptidase [Bacteroidaceae bacterium]